MGIREVPAQKYIMRLYCVTWHAANETVWEGEKSIYYCDMDGDNCYFWRLHEYFEAGWEIMELGDMWVQMTGNIWPFEKHNREKKVRESMARYIQAYPEHWSGPDPDRPRICGQEDKIVRYPLIVSQDKMYAVIEEVLEELRKRPMEDFTKSLE